MSKCQKRKIEETKETIKRAIGNRTITGPCSDEKSRISQKGTGWSKKRNKPGQKREQAGAKKGTS